jgi:hypothetical protein
VVQCLLTRLENGPPRNGAKTEVAEHLRLHVKTVFSVWKRAELEMQRSGVYRAISCKHNSGCRHRDHSQDLEALRQTSLAQRLTIPSAAAACSLPQMTLFRELKRGSLRSHNSVLRPLLTDENKRTRLAFFLEHV